jgi:hypothetical protein
MGRSDVVRWEVKSFRRAVREAQQANDGERQAECAYEQLNRLGT